MNNDCKYSAGDLSETLLASILDEVGVPPRTINRDGSCLVMDFGKGPTPTDEQMKQVDLAIIRRNEMSALELAQSAIVIDERGVRVVTHQGVIGPLLAIVVQMSAKLETLQTKFQEWEN